MRVPKRLRIFRAAVRVDFWVAARRIGYTFTALFRVGSSMVEQRPFKALVVGSSPTQPIFCFDGLAR
jgi:hypothetical protein